MLLYLPLRVQVIHHMDYLQIHILIFILNIVIIQLLSQGINLLKVVIITEVLVVYSVLIVWMLVIVVHHLGLLVVLRSTMTVLVEVVIDMITLVHFLLMHHHGVLRVLVLPIRATNNKVILEQLIIIWRLVWIIILQLCETTRKTVVIEPLLLQVLVDHMDIGAITCTVLLPIFNHHLNSLRRTILICLD